MDASIRPDRKPITVRLDQDVAARVKALARVERRPFGHQMEMLLLEALIGRDKAKHGGHA